MLDTLVAEIQNGFGRYGPFRISETMTVHDTMVVREESP